MTVKSKIPRITRCALCRYFMRSDHFKCWLCSLHHHIAEPNGGCTWGDDAE